MLALGLPAYVLIGREEPVEPATTLSLSTSTAAIGSSVTATGGGFLVGEPVNFVLQSDPITVGTISADVNNLVSLTFTVPGAAGAGAHTLTLTGASSGATVSAPITITAAAVATTTTTTTAAPIATATPRTIARGGASTDAQLLIAAALILMGGALVVAARKRRIVYPFKR